jgi:hypothetical protein
MNDPGVTWPPGMTVNCITNDRSIVSLYTLIFLLILLIESKPIYKVTSF